MGPSGGSKSMSLAGGWFPNVSSPPTPGESVAYRSRKSCSSANGNVAAGYEMVVRIVAEMKGTPERRTRGFLESEGSRRYASPCARRFRHYRPVVSYHTTSFGTERVGLTWQSAKRTGSRNRRQGTRKSYARTTLGTVWALRTARTAEPTAASSTFPSPANSTTPAVQLLAGADGIRIPADSSTIPSAPCDCCHSPP